MLEGINPRFIEIGLVKIGKLGPERMSKNNVKYNPPVKLDHFIITSRKRGDDGNFIENKSIMDRLKNGAPGNGVGLNKKGDIVKLPISLLYNNPDMNFVTKYSAFQGKKSVCSSNDGKIGYRLVKEGIEQVQCRCDWLNPAIKTRHPDTGKTVQCKPNGRLSMIIRGMKQIGGAFTFRTTSYNTISSIMGSMLYIADRTNGLLAGLDLQLVVYKQTVYDHEGKPNDANIVSIIFPGDMNDLRNQAMIEYKNATGYLEYRKKVEENGIKTDIMSKDEEDSYMAEEFYPESEFDEDDSHSEDMDHELPPEQNKSKDDPITYLKAVYDVMPDEVEKVCKDLGLDFSKITVEDAVKILDEMQG